MSKEAEGFEFLASVLALVRAQEVIQAARAEAQPLALQFGGKAEARTNPVHPVRDERFQAHRHGIIRRFSALEARP